jgi:hypothetical protein
VQAITSVQNVDFQQFHNEIVAANRPVVIKSVVADWPSVKAAQQSPKAIVDYLKAFDIDAIVSALVGKPDINGRFFYTDDLTDLNFQRTQVTLGIALDRLLTIADHQDSYAIALQAIQLHQVLPSFKPSNPQPLLEPSIEPTMWVGNRACVAPHYDIHDNLACVVAGQRKFTVFPPEQINNLYPGPALNAPGGVPVSMVDINKPDLDLYPNYTKAETAAMSAVLEPGDGIFIPALWWHGVDSLKDLNILVNYWWGGDTKTKVSPNDSLLHSMMSIANLDQNKRQAWQQYFNYYVFKTSDDPKSHLPTDLKDIVADLSPEQEAELRKFLIKQLQ